MEATAKPQTLLAIAARQLCVQLSEGVPVEDVFLNEDVCELLLRTLRANGWLSPRALIPFRDPQACSLSHLDLSGCELITCDDVSPLLQHQLLDVRLRGCENISGRLFEDLKWPLALQYLDVSRCTAIEEACFAEMARYPNLAVLDLSHTSVGRDGILAICELEGLASLGFSHTALLDGDIMHMAASLLSRRLTKLDISQTLVTAACGEALSHFTNLRELDLSYNYGIRGPEFFSAIGSLANLEVLELNETSVGSDDLELLTQKARTLRFLGLCLSHQIFNLPYSLDERENRRGSFASYAPLTIASYSSVKHIMNALAAYGKDSEYATHAFKRLFVLYRNNPPVNDNGQLDQGLEVMGLHLDDLQIQIAATASVYHLTKQTVLHQPPATRVRCIRLLVLLMCRHLDHYQLQKNICLTLCNFHIQQELEHECARIVSTLLQSAIMHKDDLIQRIAIGLSNGLVCLGGAQKADLGAAGVVKNIMHIIDEKMNEADAVSAMFERNFVLETAWSALWNVTDETSANCALFLEEGGMNLFMKAYEAFGGEAGLVRNMLGLLGNVAEVEELRGELMCNEFLCAIRDILHRDYEGIEVAYNACGIICNLMMEGPDLWRSSLSVPRDELLCLLETSTSKWSITTPRTINYRSLRPILSLADSGITQVQYWRRSIAHWFDVKALPACMPYYALTMRKFGSQHSLHNKLVQNPPRYAQPYSNKVLERGSKRGHALTVDVNNSAYVSTVRLCTRGFIAYWLCPASPDYFGAFAFRVWP